MMPDIIPAGSTDMADDHPLEEPDSSVYQTVIDEGSAMALSHPPSCFAPAELRRTSPAPYIRSRAPFEALAKEGCDALLIIVIGS
jgi:hypothetical protein